MTETLLSFVRAALVASDEAAEPDAENGARGEVMRSGSPRFMAHPPLRDRVELEACR
jgi:hypothetical protein